MIVIKGLKYGPVKGEVCRHMLYGEGGVIEHFNDKSLLVGKWKALEPHGELIDKDAVLDILRTYLQMVPIDADIANRIYEIVKDAPTVLEASE